MVLFKIELSVVVKNEVLGRQPVGKPIYSSHSILKSMSVFMQSLVVYFTV